MLASLALAESLTRSPAPPPEGVERPLDLLAFSPDGRALLSSRCGAIFLWEAATGRLLREFLSAEGSLGLLALALSPDGRAVASVEYGQTGVLLWEVATGRPRCRLVAEVQAISVCFTADSRVLAVGYADGTVRWWDVLSGRQVARRAGHRGPVTALASSAGGDALLSGGADTTVLSWEPPAGVRAAPAPVRLAAREREALWAALAGADAAKAYQAHRRLAADPRQTAAFLRRRLKPVPPPDSRRLRKWIAELDADEYAVRRRAREGLAGLGELAGPELRKALADRPPLEVHRALERLLSRLGGEGVPPPGVLRGLRAVGGLLELLSGGDGRVALRELAGGAPGARLTEEARASLRRLSGRAAVKP